VAGVSSCANGLGAVERKVPAPPADDEAAADDHAEEEEEEEA
jgi:hypothetical protein